MSLISNRQLPQIKVGGIDFYVDVISGNLIEKADISNRIYVLDMLTLEDHHEFLFDRQKKNIVEGNRIPGPYEDHQEYVWIRRMEALDPEGMKVLQEMGKAPKLPENLPVVYIGDTAFYWLEEQSAFCQADNHWNRIYKNDITVIEGEKGFYYDSILAQVPFPHELDAYKGDLPDHIYFKPVRPLFEIIKLLEKGTSKKRQSITNDSSTRQKKNKGRRMR